MPNLAPFIPSQYVPLTGAFYSLVQKEPSGPSKKVYKRLIPHSTLNFSWSFKNEKEQAVY